jgi:hypothetical protein
MSTFTSLSLTLTLIFSKDKTASRTSGKGICVVGFRDKSLEFRGFRVKVLGFRV